MTDQAPPPKLEIRIIPVTPLQQNTSMIWSTDTMDGVFIDPGGEVDKLMGAAEQFGVKIVGVWLTHGHLDHAGAATEVSERTAALSLAPTRTISGCWMNWKLKAPNTASLMAAM